MTSPYENSPQQDAGEILALFVEQFNKETLEHNQLLEALDDMEAHNVQYVLENEKLTIALDESRKENEQLLAAYKAMEKGIDQITANAEAHMVQLKQANREKEQVVDKLNQAVLTVASYKEMGSPKKIRDQRKTYQTKAATSLATITSLKKDVKGYRAEIDKLIDTNIALKTNEVNSNLTTVWSEKGNHLMLFPAPLTMSIRGKEEKQLTLLFMDNSGCGKLIGIDELGEPLVCSSPKGGLKPRKATLDKAGSMLRKYKRQGWALTKDDLDLASK